jgi:hypothetical protein
MGMEEEVPAHEKCARDVSRRGHHSLWKDRALEQLPRRRLAPENRSYEPVLEMITFAI